nr:hypothetical protein [Mucilaginibacter sp. X5P1]
MICDNKKLKLVIGYFKVKSILVNSLMDIAIGRC